MSAAASTRVPTNRSLADRTAGAEPTTPRSAGPNALSAAAGAAGHALLHWRAFDRAVRAVHAAVPGKWLEDRMAGRTLMDPPTCIGGHGLPRGPHAHRAGDNGFQFHGLHWEASMCVDIGISLCRAKLCYAVYNYVD